MANVTGDISAINSSYAVTLHDTSQVDASQATAVSDDTTQIDEIVPASKLSVQHLLALQAEIEHDIYAAREEERAEAELAMQQARCPEDVVRRMKEDAENAFILQDRFRYALPKGREEGIHPPSTIHDGVRERPACPTIPKASSVPRVPDDDASTEEKDVGYAERLVALEQTTKALQTARYAAEFDVEESLFALQSSDDSDGYDEDYDAEWREETSNVFARCRAVECNPLDDEAFAELGRLADHFIANGTVLNSTEVAMLWNALRMTYRLAEPVHVKHWLTSVSQLASDGSFASRPAIANFTFLLVKMKNLTCWTKRQQTKIERWTYRCTFLVRKRMVALQEYGNREPTWKQVHVSVGNLDRDEKVPQYTLADTLDALTEHAAPIALDGDRPEMRKYFGK